MLLVCYDIIDDRRRAKVARMLEGYGERVQKSVFECYLDPRREAELRRELARLADAACDRVRFYTLCGRDLNLILNWGCRAPPTDRHLWVA